MARKGLLVVMVLLAVLMVSATIAQAQGNQPQGPTYVGSDDTKETHQYPLGYTPGGDLSKANWQPFMPTGVVTDANWWVDGHAKQHRQQYLEWLPSAHATALDALRKPEAGGQDVYVQFHSNVSFVKADGSTGLHNYPYAQAILAQADSDLKNIEQSLTPTPLLPTAAPTVDAALQAAPGVNWLIWIGLAAIVVAVLVMLMTRKPKAS